MAGAEIAARRTRRTLLQMHGDAHWMHGGATHGIHGSHSGSRIALDAFR
jgi:hypothetical protein